jgi:hypothetical protein
MEGNKKRQVGKIHAIYDKTMKKMSTILFIYSQGGLSDRSLQPILKRRQTLTHSTFPKAKNGIPANPYPLYVSEASQTLTHSTFAGVKNDTILTHEKRPYTPLIFMFYPVSYQSIRTALPTENSCQTPQVEGK